METSKKYKCSLRYAAIALALLSVVNASTPAYAKTPWKLAVAALLGVAGAVAYAQLQVDSGTITVNGTVFESKKKFKAVVCIANDCAEANGKDIPTHVREENVVELAQGKYELAGTGEFNDRTKFYLIKFGQIDKFALVTQRV